MKIFKTARLFYRDDRAVAAVEAALVFPLLIMLFCGVLDMGRALLVNQKVITASQTAADIMSREIALSNGEIDDAFIAARLALNPYPTQSFGVDVAGIQFNGAQANPVIRWRRTQAGTIANPTIAAGAAGLGNENEGVLGVTARYLHRPMFTGTFTGDIQMQEVSYARGRRGVFIGRE